MAIRSDEITSIIKSAIDSFDAAVETRTVGTVVEVGDGIAQIYGLSGALSSELLEFPNGLMGMALNLEEETVGAVILGNAQGIKEGDTVKTTGRVVEVPVGAALLGRVVDPLGRPLDDKGPIATPEYGARYWSGAGSSAPATTTIVYSIAPYCSRMATVLATVESFWPIAT